jgi:transcriptional regulator with XRE-family HTH domain
MPLDKQTQKALYIHFGLQVRQRRKALGMSEEALGRRIGLSPERVRACERGRQVIRADLLKALMEALNIPMSGMSHLVTPTDEVLMDIMNMHSRHDRPISGNGRAVHLKPLDAHIGRRLRWKRRFMGWSQSALGRKLGITFQQVQKYENGKNTLSARRLYQLAQVLNVPVIFFFEGYDAPSAAEPSEFDKLTIALMRTYGRIRRPSARAGFLRLLKVIADLPGDGQND